MLLDELNRQRNSSRTIIDAKNKLITQMARKIGEQSKKRENEDLDSEKPSQDSYPTTKVSKGKKKIPLPRA